MLRASLRPWEACSCGQLCLIADRRYHLQVSCEGNIRCSRMIKARRSRLLPMLSKWFKCYRIQTPDDDSTVSCPSLSISRYGSKLGTWKRTIVLYRHPRLPSGVHVPSTRDPSSLRAEPRPGKYNLQTQKVHPWEPSSFILVDQNLI